MIRKALHCGKRTDWLGTIVLLGAPASSELRMMAIFG
jgi:hypothetical protein